MITIKLPTGTFEYDDSKPLGQRGGFGQVFAGRAESGDEVAVKKLHVSAADAAHRELRIAEEFRGRIFKNVIPFIDSGEDADSGDYFVVMPRAERSLQAAINADGPLGAADTAKVLLQIVAGLIEVGDLVHRDLKPDNVLFHEGEWKVADFGIARFTEEVTSTNTLKDFLSPHYAAPEQWRFERSTHATDVYTLGCVGFCLLIGKPPFTTNPSEEHQRKPVPSFGCADPRLSSLINMMLRKLSQTRPILSRIRDLLIDIVAKPHQASGADSLSALASAGAQVAEREQKLQAQQQAEAAAREARAQLARSAMEILAENVERLWGKIHGQAPNAQRKPIKRMLSCELGDCTLAIDFSEHNYVEYGVFKHSGWDVVVATQAIVTQYDPRYIWGSSLWYAKPHGASDYRWYELSFWCWGHSEFQPYASTNNEDSDLAVSRIMHNVNVAFGPTIIDDEKEDEFHERWIWLLSKASVGKLRQPATLPINQWPPNLV